MLYSKSTGGFYDPAINASIPADAVPITVATWAALLAAQSTGKVIIPDVNGSPIAVSQVSLMTLAQVQAMQIGVLAAAYTAAIAQPVSYTSKGGITKTYPTDPQSIANLSQMMLAFSGTQIVPTGFYWVSADNTQVPFTFADLQGLAAVMGAQGFAAFSHLQAQKTAVLAATTAAQVQAVVW
jgi:hypothetical protein